MAVPSSHISTTDTAELRHATDALYNQIVEQVNAVAILMPSADVEQFAVEMNSIIVQYKHIIAHQGKAKKEDEESAE